MARPYKIKTKATQELRELLDNLDVTCAFPIYVTDTRKGRCSYKSKNITVPFWVGTRGWGYAIYYACHEIAHVVAGHKAKHGPEFMKAFMEICPESFQHFELDYKPRLAKAAGISKQEAVEAEL